MKNWIILLLSGLLLLSGCSAIQGDKARVNQFDLSVGPEEITLNIVIGRPTEALTASFIQTLKQAGKLFTERYPNITVKVDDQVFGDYIARISELTDSDQPPDLIFVGSNLIPLMAEKRLLADLGLFAEMDRIALDDFYVPAIESLSSNGQWLGVPVSIYPTMVFFDKQQFDHANLPYPSGDWTWEQFYDTALQLKAASGQDSFTGGMIPNDLFGIEQLVLSKGGSLLSPDGMRTTGYLDSPEAVSAVQYMVNLFRDQNMHEEWMDPTSYGNAWISKLYYEDVGMAIASSFFRFFIDPSLSDAGGRVGYAPLPRFQDGYRINTGSTVGLGISESSRHAAAAWAFLKMFLLEHHELTASLYRYVPAPSKAIAEETGQTKDPYMSLVLEELNYIQKTAWDINPYFGEAVYSSGIYAMIDEMFKEGLDVQTQLSKIAASLDDALTAARAEAITEE